MTRFTFSGSIKTLASIALCVQNVWGQQTWPSSMDEMEDLMFLSSKGFISFVQPCGFSTFDQPGRANSAEWLRTAFHDMATAWVQIGQGGLDASLIFELAAPTNNIGQGFTDTITNMTPFLTSRSSMADLFALGVYASVRSCGGPVVPIRTGRIDATAGGTGFATNTPLAQNPIGTFIGQFAHMGFNQTAMIQLVACGHTLGVVHSTEFPDIVQTGGTSEFQALDTTRTAFDNVNVLEYLNQSSPDPMQETNAYATSETTIADTVVFNSDNNVTISGMTDPTTFNQICQSVLGQMIETVPSNVVLTNAIVVYEVKPTNIQLSLVDGGESLLFTGQIRVRTTDRSVSSVSLSYIDRNGATGTSTISTTAAGTGAGLDDTFAFYSFSTNLSPTTSISSFTVQVTTTDGTTTTFDNNGGGFPVTDTILYQQPQSCVELGSSSATLVVWAAVRNTADVVPSLNMTLKVPRTNGVIPPQLTQQQANFTNQGCMGPYTIYSASYTLLSSQYQNTYFDITAPGASGVFFQSNGDLGATCTAFQSLTSCGANTTSSSSSAAASSSSVISSSSSSTLTTTTSSASVSSSSSSSQLSSPSAASSSSSSSSQVSSSSSASSSSSLSVASQPTTTSSSTQSSSAAASSTSSAPGNPSSTAFSYLGCFVDDSSRVLSAASTESSTQMTVEFCSAFCGGYQYFGLEYGGECYCGDTEPSNAAAESDCNMLCDANPAELCGAGWRLSTYQNLGYMVPPSQDTPPIAGWVYGGCFFDQGSPRSLPDDSTSSSSMTLESCAAFCAGYNFFGTEYGSQCYCGYTLNSAAVYEPATDCSMGCGGNASEICGGNWRLTVYNATTTTTPVTPLIPANVDGYTSLGCWSDNADGRALPNVYYNDTSMTLELCASVASANGAAYFGAEYSQECWYGSTLGGGNAAIATSSCNMQCKGNASEYCGGSNALTLYSLSGSAKFRYRRY